MSKTLNMTDPKRSDFAGPCPRCKGPVPNAMRRGEYPGALSRFDNETYICSDCGTQEAFGAGHLIPLTVDLYSDEAKTIRAEFGEHEPEVLGALMSCGCGTDLGAYSDSNVAQRAYRSHVITAAGANRAHGEGRHNGGTREDLNTWAALGCRECKGKVSA